MTGTHFGFETVGEEEKTRRVRGVFDSVSARYDIMNDLMSFGLHRLWKACAVLAAHARPGDRVLDIAGGTGDLTRAFARQVGPQGCVWHTDINESMLRAGRERLINQGVLVPSVLCDAEALPFADGQFDLVSVAFGLRNMTHMDTALREMQRVLRVGGKLLVLEFSRVPRWLQKPYDWYSFGVLPALGQMVAGDAASYRYLAESVRRHPGQDELKALMHGYGFGHVHYINLSAGICALHVGIRCAAGEPPAMPPSGQPPPV